MGAGSEMGHQAVRSLTGGSHHDVQKEFEETKNVQKIDSIAQYSQSQEMTDSHPCANLTMAFLNVNLNLLKSFV